MKLHIDYCKSFGIEIEEIEATEEHQGTEPSPSRARLFEGPQKTQKDHMNSRRTL